MENKWYKRIETTVGMGTNLKWRTEFYGIFDPKTVRTCICTAYGRNNSALLVY